tara:strand:- start:154 stop:573 length:420 start_codon:yes stop_codon:yes gene_type:complete
MAVLRREENKNTPNVNIHDVHTILGPESSFEGKLIFEGTVRIDGNFKGEIQTKNILIVGQGARVEANINVGKIVVNGEVLGDITAKESIELNSPAIVRGTIAAPQLTIAKGVIFEGNCRMEDLSKEQTASVTVLNKAKE